MTNTNIASGAADDSLLLCASDLQHSAIYDNHVEMQACIRAVANRIAALASAAAPAEQPATAYAEMPECDASTVGLGKVWNRHSMRAFADATHALRLAARGQAPAQAAPAAVASPGWKLVPVEPTPEMWRAARAVPDPNPPYPLHYALVWDAMLAAAPSIKQGGQHD